MGLEDTGANELTQTEKEQRFSVNGLRLKGVSRLGVGDVTVSPDDLATDRKKWAGYALIPGIGADKRDLPDAELARTLLYELVPVEITGEGDTALRIQIEKFPYKINGDDSFQSFGMRISPEQGSIRQVVLNSRRSVAVNELEVSQSQMVLETGNGSLHLEIAFTPLPPESRSIPAPKGFKSEVTFDPKDSID